MICFGVSLLLLSQPSFAKSNSYSCGSVTTSFVKYELNGNDFYVYYSVPPKAGVTWIGNTDRAKDTLGKAQKTLYGRSKKRDMYELIAGARARAFGLRYSGDEKGLKSFVSEVCARYRN